MKLTRTRSYKLNMGNYESLEVSATASIDGADVYDEADLAQMDPDVLQQELQERCERYLDKMLEPELDRAGEISLADKSVLFTDPPAPPTTSQRRRSRR